MSLQECFDQVVDPRKESGLRHPLSSFLSMMTMAYMSGQTGYRGCSAFMEGNEQSFIEMFNLKHGTPRHTQIRTIINRLDFAQINRAFFRWINQFVSIEKGEWISGDGKSLKSTVIDPHGSGQDFELMVRLFSQRLGIVLQTERTRNKKTEKKAFQELLTQLGLKGVIITLDAAHCQKKTAADIIESENDYLIAVKNNQPKLFKQIQLNVQQSIPIDSCLTGEKNRGRTENRLTEVYDNLEGIDPVWVGIKRIIRVHRFGYRPDKGEYDEEHYYIVSKPIDDAELLSQGIRGHWFIENSLHWVKDVNFNEDKNKIKNGKSAAVLSVFQDIAINIYKCKGYKSIKKGTIHFANKVKELQRFLNAYHISDL